MDIKREAEREAEVYEQERREMHQTIETLQAEVNRFLDENRRLRVKYSKSRSRNHRSRERSDLDHSTPTAGDRGSRRVDPEQHSRQDAFLSVRNISGQSGQGLEDSAVKELLTLKMEVKRKNKEVLDLQRDVDQFMSNDRKIEEEFGKTLDEIISEYRESIGRKSLLHSKSHHVLQKWKEAEPWSVQSKFECRDEGEGENGAGTKQESGRQGKRLLNSPHS